jgi:hypothetical protein
MGFTRLEKGSPLLSERGSAETLRALRKTAKRKSKTHTFKCGFLSETASLAGPLLPVDSGVTENQVLTAEEQEKAIERAWDEALADDARRTEYQLAWKRSIDRFLEVQEEGLRITEEAERDPNFWRPPAKVKRGRRAA